MSEPGPHRSKHSIDSKCFASQTSSHNQHKGPEKQVHTKHLTLGITSTNRGCQQEPATDVCGSDPKDGKLDVPGSQQITRKKIGNVDSVKTLRVCAIVRGGAANKHLSEKQKND